MTGPHIRAVPGQHAWVLSHFMPFGSWPVLILLANYPVRPGTSDFYAIDLDGSLRALCNSIRWIVECTFGWFNCYRRLSIDCELLPATSEAIIQVTMIHLMIRRLARIASY